MGVLGHRGFTIVLRIGDSESHFRDFLRWHVCRVNFARRIFLELRLFSYKKMLRNFPRKCLAFSLWVRKIPQNFRQIPTKFPCEKSKKIHRRASAGAQGERFYFTTISLIFVLLTTEILAIPGPRLWESWGFAALCRQGSPISPILPTFGVKYALQ